MRTLILAIAAIAALALPTTAIADPVEVLDGATDQPCDILDHGALNSEIMFWNETEGSLADGCVLDMASAGAILFNPGSSPCNWAFTLNVGPDGHGVVSDISITGSAGCGVGMRECTDDLFGEDLLWPFQIEHDGAGNMSFDIETCIYRSSMNRNVRSDLTLQLHSGANGIYAVDTGNSGSATAWLFNPTLWYTNGDPAPGSLPNPWIGVEGDWEPTSYPNDVIVNGI